MTDFINNPQDEENKVLYKGFYEDGTDMRVVRVEDGIVEIGENAFRDCETLEEVYLPKTLRKISACAGEVATNLKGTVHYATNAILSPFIEIFISIASFIFSSGYL